MAEERKGSGKLGTTGRGICPCYEDKAARRGMRISDVLLRERIDAKLAALREHFEALCRGYAVTREIDWKKTADDLEAFGRWAADRIAVGCRRGAARAERKGEAEGAGEAGKLDLHGMGPTDCDGMRQRAAWEAGRALSWMECVGGLN